LSDPACEMEHLYTVMVVPTAWEVSILKRDLTHPVYINQLTKDLHEQHPFKRRNGLHSETRKKLLACCLFGVQPDPRHIFLPIASLTPKTGK